MTAAEAFELTTQGGTSDFARVIRLCQSCGPYCLIGGLAVNCYVEPVYTLDADFVLASRNLEQMEVELDRCGFKVEQQSYTVNAQSENSQLRIQFTKDERYAQFPFRSIEAEVLGVPVWIASLEDLVQGKIWAYTDSGRRFSKRQKDKLDLIRLAESFPHLLSGYPDELRAFIASN